jgi:CDP-diacylglycerol pyrophosphatase
MLLIPTTKITGIESPALLAPGAPNYFQDAWAAQSFVDHLAGQTIPREDLGLAINSEDGRSQDQLHIHVDCVMPDVKQTLTAHLAEVGDKWAPFAEALEGHRYEAMRVAGADLAANNPFRLLADGDPAAKTDMGVETIVVVGETFPSGPGFVLLADRADPASGDMGSGETLLDHDCQVLKPPA